MAVENIKLGWANLKEIDIGSIKEEAPWFVVSGISPSESSPKIDVYTCSDTRKFGLRKLLSQVQDIAIHSTAGNIVYEPSQRPSVVIAHEPFCGAVHYKNGTKGNLNPPLKGLAALVEDAIDKNAIAQMERVHEDYRGQVISFNQQTGEIRLIRERTGSKAKYAGFIYDELEKLASWIPKEILNLSDTQNPKVILLKNFATHYAGQPLFRVSLQMNKLHEVVADSLQYAMDKAMKGNGDGDDFKDTKYTVMAFRNDKPIPDGFPEFLNSAYFIEDYVNRGGSIYLVSVGHLPSQKKVFNLVPK